MASKMNLDQGCNTRVYHFSFKKISESRCNVCHIYKSQDELSENVKLHFFPVLY